MNLVQARDLVPNADILERLFFLFPLQEAFQKRTDTKAFVSG
jgi:hypothetical protein